MHLTEQTDGPVTSRVMDVHFDARMSTDKGQLEMTRTAGSAEA